MLHHLADGTTITVRTNEPQMDTERGARREAALNDGDRVRLVALAQWPTTGYDDRPNLPPGTEGTVRETWPSRVTDGGGSLAVEWDNGSRLFATTDDRVVKVDDPDATPL